jgi:hypothetical protein
MRRGNIFWGGILILLGGLFILQESGRISDVFGWFWPLLLVLLGAWILVGYFMPRAVSDDQGDHFALDLQGATQVALNFNHGAGAVQMSDGAPAGVAVTGTRAAGMSIESHLTGDKLDVKIDAGPSFIPFVGPESGMWRFRFNQDVPLSLNVDAGASNLDFDLTDLKVTYIKVDTGASTLKMKLPARAGNTVVDIDSGATTLDLIVPHGVAARVRTKQAASTINVDQSRFPQRDGLPEGQGAQYQSADYETAANKVEIDLDGGANTVNVR